eukprot:1160136-Pelagomonas_calceolata.AAC.18
MPQGFNGVSLQPETLADRLLKSIDLKISQKVEGFTRVYNGGLQPETLADRSLERKSGSAPRKEYSQRLEAGEKYAT